MDTEVVKSDIDVVKKCCDTEETVKQNFVENVSHGEYLDENVTDAEVEKLLIKKQQENPKLCSICHSGSYQGGQSSHTRLKCQACRCPHSQLDRG